MDRHIEQCLSADNTGMNETHIIRDINILRPYACALCAFRCTNKPSVLKVHMRTHTGEKLHNHKICATTPPLMLVTLGLT